MGDVVAELRELLAAAERERDEARDEAREASLLLSCLRSGGALDQTGINQAWRERIDRCLDSNQALARLYREGP